MLNEEVHRLRAQFRAIDLALDGEGEVARGEYAWTETLGRVRKVMQLLNAPEIIDFAVAVQLEAAHQRARWGSDHDAGKTDADWFWLIGYLAGKALHNPDDSAAGKARMWDQIRGLFWEFGDEPTPTDALKIFGEVIGEWEHHHRNDPQRSPEEAQLHRIITVAAAAANWHAAKLGQTNMRPGIATPVGETP